MVDGANGSQPSEGRRVRHTETALSRRCFSGAPGATRTPNLLIRSPEKAVPADPDPSRLSRLRGVSSYPSCQAVPAGPGLSSGIRDQDVIRCSLGMLGGLHRRPRQPVSTSPGAAPGEAGTGAQSRRLARVQTGRSLPQVAPLGVCTARSRCRQHVEAQTAMSDQPRPVNAARPSCSNGR